MDFPECAIMGVCLNGGGGGAICMQRTEAKLGHSALGAVDFAF